MIRKVADALSYQPGERLRLMVIAEILTPEEARSAQEPMQVPHADLLTDDELLIEVKRRMRRKSLSQ